MTITIKIHTYNAAFQDNREGELASILGQAIGKLTRNESRYWHTVPIQLFDSNGNNVGTIKVTDNSNKMSVYVPKVVR